MAAASPDAAAGADQGRQRLPRCARHRELGALTMARKSTTKEQSHIGLQRLQLIGCIAHGLAPEVRASSGLASALLALYGAKLEEAERDAERRGNSCSDDGGAAYRLQCCHVQDLRGLVAILVTLSATLVTANGRAARMAEMTR